MTSGDPVSAAQTGPRDPVLNVMTVLPLAAAIACTVLLYRLSAPAYIAFVEPLLLAGFVLAIIAGLAAAAGLAGPRRGRGMAAAFLAAALGTIGFMARSPAFTLLTHPRTSAAAASSAMKETNFLRRAP